MIVKVILRSYPENVVEYIKCDKVDVTEGFVRFIKDNTVMLAYRDDLVVDVKNKLGIKRKL